MIPTFGYGDPDSIPASFGYGEAGGTPVPSRDWLWSIKGPIRKWFVRAPQR